MFGTKKKESDFTNTARVLSEAVQDSLAAMQDSLSRRTLVPTVDPLESVRAMNLLDEKKEEFVFSPRILKPISINIDKETATAQYEDYGTRPNPTATEKKLAIIYGAITQEQKIINIRETLIGVGLDQSYRPRAAFGRASAASVEVEVNRFGSVWFKEAGEFFFSYTTPNFTYIPPSTSFRSSVDLAHAQATVPVIPGSLRPDNLDDFSILWEPLWHDLPLRRADPILLRHIEGDLYAVIASWDTSPVEDEILRSIGL